MRHQQKIYNQNGNKVRNRDLLNVNMSSDVCVFIAPTFDISGATKIETGTTSASTGVYLVDDNSGDIDFTFSFTGDMSTLDSESVFKYEVYKYDYDNLVFKEPALIKSEDITYSAFSATSAITETIPVSDLNHDGEYLIKGYYTHEVCTDIFGRLGVRNDTSFFKNGSLYGLYNPSIDYTFAVIEKAEIPVFSKAGATARPLGSLVAFSILPDDGETVFPITTNVSGDLMVFLNGLMLADDLDYTYSADVITLSAKTITGDVLTYVSVVNAEANGVVVDNIQVFDPIPSGPTDGEGTNKYYYNTAQAKYEIYTSLTPINFNDMSVTLNGVTLAPNIDFYQSVTNPNRIILEGNLLDGDVVNIIYNAYPGFVGEIYTNNPSIYWTIPAPQQNNGIFTVEVAEDATFSGIVSTAQTEYSANVVTYSAEVTITGGVGTNLVYRVLNEKNYVTLDGDIISTSAYSEVVPITIMSNAINSY